jgi:DNA-binding IclR family transcriptional regulator
LCAYRANSPLAITDNVQAGEMRPLERGAGGKVLLAFVGRQGSEFDTIREEMF